MIWVNWIPEISQVAALMLILFLQSYRIRFIRLIPAVVLLFSSLGLGYFWIRYPSFSPDAPFQSLQFDVMANFGRSLVLLALSFSSIFVWIHPRMTGQAKIRWITVAVFVAFFASASFLVKPLLFYLLAWLGVWIGVLYLVSIESPLGRLRSRWTVTIAGYLIAATIMTALSIYFPDSLEWRAALGWFLNLGFPLGLLLIQGFSARAPLSLGWASLWLFLGSWVFWTRFGSGVIEQNGEFVGSLFLVSALSAAVIAIRQGAGEVWRGAILYSVCQLMLLVVLLAPDQGGTLVYSIGLFWVIGTLFGGAFFSVAEKDQWWTRVLFSLSMVGWLPAVTADLFFALTTSLVKDGKVLFAGLFMITWVFLSLSVLQQFSSWVAPKRSTNAKSTLAFDQSILLIAFLLALIVLAFVNQPLLQLLNHHTSGEL